MPIFVYDAQLRVTAETKEEADYALYDAAQAVDGTGATLVVLDAYGVEDADTGEEMRPVK